MYEYKAKVVKVVDGDTIDVLIDLGFHTSLETRLRLNGINAPEMSTAAGKEAKTYVLSWLTTCPSGTDVIVHTDRDRTEKYGRYLGTIYAAGEVAAGLPSLNDAMVAAGHAVPYFGGAR